MVHENIQPDFMVIEITSNHDERLSNHLESNYLFNMEN